MKTIEELREEYLDAEREIQWHLQHETDERAFERAERELKKLYRELTKREEEEGI